MLEVLCIANLIFILPITVIVYLFAFIYLAERLSTIMRYVFFVAIGLFITVFSGFIGQAFSISASVAIAQVSLMPQVIGVVITTYLLLCSAYFY